MWKDTDDQYVGSQFETNQDVQHRAQTSENDADAINNAGGGITLTYSDTTNTTQAETGDNNDPVNDATSHDEDTNAPILEAEQLPMIYSEHEVTSENDSVDLTLIASSNSSSDGNTIYVSDGERSEHTFNYREPIRYTSESSMNKSKQNDRSSGIDTKVSINYKADNDDISNDDNFNTEDYLDASEQSYDKDMAELIEVDSDDDDDIDNDDEHDDIAYMSEDMLTDDYADDLD
ncbi:hypothetical protein LPJ73_001793, partial [Coemansia sp. RSA 2703]